MLAFAIVEATWGLLRLFLRSAPILGLSSRGDTRRYAWALSRLVRFFNLNVPVLKALIGSASWPFSAMSF